MIQTALSRSILAAFLSTVFALCSYGQDKPANAAAKLLTSFPYDMSQPVIEAEIDGKVVIAIHLDEAGIPKSAVLTTGPMWPCGKTPTSALMDLSKALADAAMKTRFSPAIKNGKAVAADIGLTLMLKNPRLEPKPAEIDPLTGEPVAKIISGGVINGKAKSLPRPAYPESAKPSRTGGLVTILILINEEGHVVRAGATDGPAVLQTAAQEAACEAKFTPTLLAGHPVKVSGVITYNFVP